MFRPGLLRSARLAASTLRKPKRPLSLAAADVQHHQELDVDIRVDVGDDQWDSPWALASWQVLPAYMRNVAVAPMRTVMEMRQHRQALPQQHHQSSLEEAAEQLLPVPQDPAINKTTVEALESQDEDADMVDERLSKLHMDRAWKPKKATRSHDAPAKRKKFPVDPRHHQLAIATKKRDLTAAMELFQSLMFGQEHQGQLKTLPKEQEQAQTNEPGLNLHRTSPVRLQAAKSLFRLAVSQKEPIIAAEIFEYLVKDMDSSNFQSGIVLEMCEAVNYISPQFHRASPSRDIIFSVRNAIRKADRKTQIFLMTRLLDAIVSQQSVAVGRCANVIYQDLMEMGVILNSIQIKRLLKHSKYNRKRDLPHHELLEMSLSTCPPPPWLVGQVIQNMFPYTYSEEASTAIRAFVKIQEMQLKGEIPNLKNHSYSLPIGTLEHIAAGAATAGCTEAVLSVWDVLEQSQMAPTLSIYESTVISFAGNIETLPNAFQALASMQEEGYPVHRALIRNFSTAIRSENQNLRHAFNFLRSDDGVNCRSVEAINVLLSAYAERGDIWLFQAVMDFMHRCGITPDVETYSFAIEVLGKDVYRAFAKNKKRDFSNIVQLADEYLSRMEQQGLAPTADVIRNYVELLCLVGELSTAVGVIEDMRKFDAVNSKTIYRVASACANNFLLEDAKRIASYAKAPMKTLEGIIRSREQRRDKLEGVKEKRKETDGDQKS